MIKTAACSGAHLWCDGGSVLLVQLDDDPETHQNVLLVLDLAGGAEGAVRIEDSGTSNQWSPVRNLNPISTCPRS